MAVRWKKAEQEKFFLLREISKRTSVVGEHKVKENNFSTKNILPLIECKLILVVRSAISKLLLRVLRKNKKSCNPFSRKEHFLQITLGKDGP